MTRYLWTQVLGPTCKKKVQKCLDKKDGYKEIGEGGKDKEGKPKCEDPNVDVEICDEYYKNDHRFVLYFLQDAYNNTGLVAEWSDEDFTSSLEDLFEVLEEVNENLILITSGHYTPFVMSRLHALGKGALTAMRKFDANKLSNYLFRYVF